MKKTFISFIASLLAIAFIFVVSACSNNAEKKFSDEEVGKSLSTSDSNDDNYEISESDGEDSAATINATDVSDDKYVPEYEESVNSSEEITTDYNVENSDIISQKITHGESLEKATDEKSITEENTEDIESSSEAVITPGVESSEDDEGDTSFNYDMLENVSTSATIEVIDGITYVNGILIVNKTYSLPSTYAPQYSQEVLDSLNRMFSDALKAGYTLKTKSGYRSYIDQKIIYNNYVARDGKELADTYSARPGHSEHQSGLAFDLNQLLKSFGDTPEGIWLAQNCHKYGFIIRYPEGKEHITGYMYEPWHVRYLGVEIATKVFESGLCLEEFLGITSQYTY